MNNTVQFIFYKLPNSDNIEILLIIAYLYILILRLFENTNSFPNINNKISTYQSRKENMKRRGRLSYL